MCCMSSIYSLSERELFQLKSIDPYLSRGWEQVLFQILPKLDKENQLIINEDVLAPRGIHYDRVDKKFKVAPVKTLQGLLSSAEIHNKDMIRMINYMMTVMESDSDTVSVSLEAEEVADTIESVLSQLDKVPLSDHDNPRMKHEVRKAFLYEVARWIDTIDLVVKPGLRKLNQQIAKAYLKEVFIKQQIQGMDFRSWDAFDVKEVGGIPKWVEQGVTTRKCYMVETPQFWFLIGQAESAEQNPFSFRRFLYEDDGDGYYEAFITHVAIPRPLLDNPNVVKLMQRCIGRIYTLDNTISEAVRIFVRRMRDFQNKQLVPLLQQQLRHNGADTEKVIHSRLMDYEKLFTSSILNQLPSIIQNVAKSEADQNYLFYYLDSITKQMIESIEDFRLQPITRFSASADIMSIKLASFNLLLKKSRHILCNGMDEQQKTDIMTEPLKMLSAKLESVTEEIEEFEEYREELLAYQQKQNQPKSFWNFLKRDRAPDYTMEEIREEEYKELEKFFLFIVRLEKTKRDIVVYPELEIYKSFNEEYRHYAFADGRLGVGRLPKVVRLTEDRSRFRIQDVQKVVYFDILRGFDKVVSDSLESRL